MILIRRLTYSVFFFLIVYHANAYQYSGQMSPLKQFVLNDHERGAKLLSKFQQRSFAPHFTVSLKYSQSDDNPDLQMIRQRVIHGLMEPDVDQQEVAQIMHSIQADGSWPEINYEDVSRTGFQHAEHLNRMVILSRAYQKEGSGYYHNTQLKKAIDASLAFWLEHDFICDNWWWNQIGTPDRLVSTLLIMDESLSEEQKTKAAPIVGRANLGAWGARPGGDLIKIAGIYGKYALFTRDSDILQEVVNTMASEIAFAEERNTPEDRRGMQTDLSFHHRRDRVTSILSYGLNYAASFAEWAANVAGTQYSFPEDRIQLLVDYYLDGICKSMVYAKYPDPGAKNRSISREGTLHPYDTSIPSMLLQATDYRQAELEEIVKIRKGEIAPNLTFNKFFWHTEYLSHQRPNYFTSIRMFSSRNHSMEQPYNSEGLKNHHLGDGANFISRTGEEYYNIFPIWDWQKIPGTTVVQKPGLPSEDEIQKKGLTDFVGGVTDRKYGTAAFDFKSPLDPLKAKKAWFMFDQEFVCLGTGIQSEAEYPVATTLNQTYLKGEVRVRQGKKTFTLEKGTHPLNKTDWIYHDEVAYIFPEASKVQLKNQQASGSWYSINHQSDSPKDTIRQDLFTLWLDHGTKPEKAEYAYIVVPAIEEADIESYRSNLQLNILANTVNMQAVQHTALGISQIVFYQPGQIDISQKTRITSENAALVMLQTQTDKVKNMSVADPSRKLETVHLQLNQRIETNADGVTSTWNEAAGVSDIIITLPQGESAGQTVTLKNTAL